MRFNITYQKDSHFFYVVTDGEMSYQAFKDMSEAILSQDNFVPGSNVLFDHRKLDFSKVSSSDITSIKDFHFANEARIGSGKSAMLIPKDKRDMWFKMWQMDERRVVSNTVKVFSDYDEAEEWIIL
ncbi:MAG: hypothetical protein ABIB11_03430 [Candidatus Omnitrophota bacterium]